MAADSTLTRQQLSTLFLHTELGGSTRHLNHFSYAREGISTYSFGLVQFDVGRNTEARRFLRDNGFTNGDIELLSQQGGLSRQQLATLDAKLQAIPQANIDQLTNSKLDSSIARVDAAIAKVREINPGAADAIVTNPELQLAMADYDNQFGSMGAQFINYLAGNAEKLQGGIVQASDPPTRGDVQAFVAATKYGIQSPAAVASRDERFDTAMRQLDIPVTGPVEMRSDQIQSMQRKLAELGYPGRDGAPLVDDGHFGPNTRHALQQFQHDQTLTVDGRASTSMLEAMGKAIEQKAAQTTMATPGHADNPRFQQVVERLDDLEKQRRQQGLPPLFDGHSQRDNAAGHVVCESKAVGMRQVDSILARPDGAAIFAVQGQPGDPAAQRACINLSHALNQDMQASTRHSEALDNKLSPPLTNDQVQTPAPLSR